MAKRGLPSRFLFVSIVWLCVCVCVCVCARAGVAVVSLGCRRAFVHF